MEQAERAQTHEVGGIAGDGPLREGQSLLEVRNGAAYRAARGRLKNAGAGADGPELVCDRCPVPRIMPYGRAVHREIALVSAVGIVERLRRRVLRRSGT